MDRDGTLTYPFRSRIVQQIMESAGLASIKFNELRGPCHYSTERRLLIRVALSRQTTGFTTKSK
jgi:hypothetical protein